MSNRLSRSFLLAIAAACVLAPAAAADPLVGVDTSCFAPPGPAGDPAPGTPEWQQRDTDNQRCATLRLRDQFLSRAFGWGNLTQGASLWVDQAAQQAGEPSHVHGGVTTLIPGSQAADPFRTLTRWTDQGRGLVTAIKFTSLDGAQLRGHVFMPPLDTIKRGQKLPGVVITDGSVQAYENLYYWAAEDLAASGYVVMTYDVQGQGDSDLFPANCPDPGNPTQQCPGVPYQQNYNFYQGAEDSLNFFLSAKDPYRKYVDASRIAIAGHSLGAAAVTEVGQCDKRVKTIVAWDNLGVWKDCTGVTVPPEDQATGVHTPALALTNDYAFNPQPMSSPPNPHSRDAGYQQLAKAGVDTQIVAFRNATHLTYSYIPAALPANELGERMASYYTLAWLDYRFKNAKSGFKRLSAPVFDDSVDKLSIGAGVYDQTGADPTDPYSGNIPYTIARIPVKDAVSFYYESEYSLRNPDGGTATCLDMRASCPATAPPTP